MLRRIASFLLCFLCAGSLAAAPAPLAAPEPLALVRRLPAFSQWRLKEVVSLHFATFHPQGLVKLGRRFFLSTVDTGSQSGDLIEFDGSGKELRRLRMADGRRDHAGGIDYDPSSGKIWLPLAEYRPKSSADILRIDPVSFSVERVARFPSHVGGLMFDAAAQRLRMINWDYGIYSVPLSPNENFQRAREPWRPFFPLATDFQYQDCKSLGEGYAVCGGVGPGALWPEGTVDLIRFEGDRPADSRTHYRVVRRVLVPRVSVAGRALSFPALGRPLTENPMAVEVLKDAAGQPFLRLYFVPYDGPDSALLVYDVGRAEPVASSPRKNTAPARS